MSQQLFEQDQLVSVFETCSGRAKGSSLMPSLQFMSRDSGVMFASG